MLATLQRLVEHPDGTFGKFTIGPLTFYSLELPWRNNAPSVSCIPPGLYKAVLTHSPRFGRPLYLVGPVSGRTGIRIHAANLARQLNGCIALGERLGVMDGVRCLLLSAPAVRRLETYTEGRPFSLEIRRASLDQ